MLIKDLEMNKALDRKALSEVRGGWAYAGGQNAPQTVFGGGVLSPVVASNSPINAPSAFDNDVYSSLGLEFNTANVLNSALVGVFQ